MLGGIVETNVRKFCYDYSSTESHYWVVSPLVAHYLLQRILPLRILSFTMGEILNRRLRQNRFESPVQEASLNLLVASGYLTGRMDSVFSIFKVSLQQHNILRILRGVHPAGYPCGEIAVRMLDRSPDITRRLDGLEKEGLVQRDRMAEDRRVVITTITPKGLDLLSKIEPHIASLFEDLKKKLSNDDCNELSRICESIYDETVD